MQKLKKRQLGITLLEMMITLAIAAILVTIVAPGAQSILQKNQIAAEINDVSAALQFARFQAIEQQRTTIVCPSSDYSQCDNDDWRLAKIVFTDANGNGRRDANEALLFSTQPMSSTNAMTGPDQSIRFDDFGGITAATSILLCPNNNNDELARQLDINLQGKVRLSRDTNNDGVHEDDAGNSLDCA